ncbi:hypothetical protein F5B19DRAFT_458440 [Rostrohypoxylon terebratum]|nr:hypothetical protein F5B19DRAFT_458440 [Rostrohypoxylon terebratum]
MLYSPILLFLLGASRFTTTYLPRYLLSTTESFAQCLRIVASTEDGTLSEDMVYMRPKNSSDDILQQTVDIGKRYSELSAEKKVQFEALHSWYDPVLASALQIRLQEFNAERASDLIELYTIYMNNQFTVEEATRGQRGDINPPVSAVFLQASRLNHSCNPNSDWTTLRKPGRIIVYATRTIEVGSEINICYLLNRTGDRERRRWELSLRWGFDCLCLQCQTVDETPPEPEPEPGAIGAIKPIEPRLQMQRIYDLWKSAGYDGRIGGYGAIPEVGTGAMKSVVELLLKPYAIPSLGWLTELVLIQWDEAVDDATSYKRFPENFKTPATYARVETWLRDSIGQMRRIFVDNDPILLDAENFLSDFIEHKPPPANPST